MLLLDVVLKFVGCKYLRLKKMKQFYVRFRIGKYKKVFFKKEFLDELKRNDTFFFIFLYKRITYHSL